MFQREFAQRLSKLVVGRLYHIPCYCCGGVRNWLVVHPLCSIVWQPYRTVLFSHALTGTIVLRARVTLVVDCASCQAWRYAVLPPVCQHTTTCSCGPRHEGWEEQFPPATQGTDATLGLGRK